MLLTRILFFALIAAALSGCGVTYDADAVARRRVGGQRVEPAVGEYSFLGFHRDNSADRARVRRAAHLSGDPKLEPSAREQRRAKSLALAEAQLIEDGGLMLYRWDGSANRPSQVEYVAMPGALTVNYHASKQLNCVDGDAKALTLVIYHLSDRAALDQLSSHEDGMRRLLAGDRFDDAVKGMRKFYAQPGSQGQLLFDRPLGGKYVAIVAGYDCLDAEKTLYVTEYGLGMWKMRGEDILSNKKLMFQPLPLCIDVRLGAGEMAAKNGGRMLGKLMKAQELEAEQLRYLRIKELGWNRDMFMD